MKNTSQRRQIASRANGAKSRGPKTPEGKAKSSYNAIRHGLLAKLVVLEGESFEGFEETLCKYAARFQPLDDVEFGMVEEMAACYWRMRRGWAIETTLLNNARSRQPQGNDEMNRLASAFSELSTMPQLALLNRYEARLHRMSQRALKNLFLLRDDKLRNEPSPISAHPGGSTGPRPKEAARATESTATPPPAGPAAATAEKPPQRLLPVLAGALVLAVLLGISARAAKPPHTGPTSVRIAQPPLTPDMPDSRIRKQESRMSLRPVCLLAATAALACAQDISADRMVAEWMLRMGGSVVLEGQRRPITDLADLPTSDFHIHTLNFTGITQWAMSLEEELRRLPPVAHGDRKALGMDMGFTASSFSRTGQGFVGRLQSLAESEEPAARHRLLRPTSRGG